MTSVNLSYQYNNHEMAYFSLAYIYNWIVTITNNIVLKSN